MEKGYCRLYFTLRKTFLHIFCFKSLFTLKGVMNWLFNFYYIVV